MGCAPDGHPKEDPTSIVLVPFHCNGVKREEDIGDDHFDRLLPDDKGG